MTKKTLTLTAESSKGKKPTLAGNIVLKVGDERQKVGRIALWLYDKKTGLDCDYTGVVQLGSVRASCIIYTCDKISEKTPVMRGLVKDYGYKQVGEITLWDVKSDKDKSPKYNGKLVILEQTYDVSLW